MKVVDTNVLLYAVDPNAHHHRAAKRWLDSALSNPEPIGFAWIVVVAFIRLTTNPRVFPHPLTTEQALDVVDGWLSQPPSVVLTPKSGHLGALRELLRAVGSGGNLVNDAHIAALAVENRANVVSFDNDFGRFPSVRWEQPEP